MDFRKVNAIIRSDALEKVEQRLHELKTKFRKLSERQPHLAGDSTYFGDMPDWNPAEIIGDNPNYLDYSLYDYLITDSAWHEARTSQGYYNVNPAKLVVLLGNKPYIDVRNTFNSFVPAALSQKLREKLVDFYLDKLEKNPDMQDKVEFEVLFTCYDMAFGERAEELSKPGFAREDIEELKQALIWAPSAANLQARNFYFVFNREIKNKIAEKASAKNKIIMSQAPLIIIACTDELKIEKFGGRGKNVYLITDIASSLQNATLVAHEHGLGSCWLGNFDEGAVREILNLPANLRPLMILSVGYPAETPAVKDRVNLDEAVAEVK